MNPIFSAIIAVAVVVSILLIAFIYKRFKRSKEKKPLIQGGNVDEYTIERADGSKLIVQLCEKVDWKHLKEPTLALIEADSYWFLNEIYSLRVPDIYLGNIAWTYMKELFEANPDSFVTFQSMKPWQDRSLAKNVIAKAKEPIPENLDIVFCDHVRELSYNPLASPYLEIETSGKPRDFCDSHYVSHNILMDWFYNKAKEPEYYQRLLKKWCWMSLDECEKKLNMLMEMNCFEVFNDFTFGIYEDMIMPRVKDYFSSIKYKDYGSDPTSIFNDLVLMNEIELEASCDQFSPIETNCTILEQKARDARSRKHSTVVICSESSRHQRYIEFLTHSEVSKRTFDYEKKIAEALEYAKRNHRDLSGKYGKFVKELMDTFRYDNKSEENGFKNWKLRSIEELDKEKIWICHDSAYYVSTKLKERFPSIKTWRLSFTRIGRDRTHGLTVIEDDDGFYVVDACHTHSSGVFGPFKTFEKTLDNLLMRNYPHHAYFSQMLVDHTKPGAPYSSFKTTIDLSGHFESVDHAPALGTTALKAPSKLLAIYLHGMNPNGEKYAEQLTRTMRSRLPKDKVSFGCYYRSRHCSELTDEKYREFIDTYDLDVEWIRFKIRLYDEFKEELNGPCKIYLFGHSYGACFAKFFGYKLRELKSPFPLEIIAVSLDGSDLHTTVPFFIGEGAKDEEIEYKEEGPIWKGKNYINTNGIYKGWYDNMMRCDKLPNEKYLIIDYFANEKDPKKATLEYRGNPIYERYWELSYGKEYSHSLHSEKPCWELIWKLVSNYK